MGALGVLHSQDCLRDQALMYSHMKPRRNPNPNPNPTPNSAKSNRRKRSPGKKKNSGNNKMADNFPAKNLIMGQVKILKRGEELTALRKNLVDGKKAGDSDDFVLSSTHRLGPEPEMVPKQMRLGDYYAGSEVISSPPPSSLPFPAFFTKKIVLDSVDDVTTDLGRLLRL